MLIKKILLIYVVLLLIMTFLILPVKKNVVYSGGDYLRTLEVNNYTSNIFSTGKQASSDNKTFEIVVVDYQKYILYIFICTLISSTIYLSTYLIRGDHQ